MEDKYNLSFDPHYNLVIIHPWADGNGRMARLVMNWIRFQLGLIQVKILKVDKEDYIKALVGKREIGDLSIFSDFMKQSLNKNLSKETKEYEKDILDIEPNCPRNQWNKKIVNSFTKMEK